MTKQQIGPERLHKYYKRENILDEITDEPVDLSLNEQLRQDIVSGKRRRNLRNITIKIDPLHIRAIKKLATMKSIPYQTLIRHWIVEDIKKELDLILK